MTDRSSQTPDLPTLDDQLCFAIYSANTAINRMYRPYLNKLGLTYPQYIALLALWETDDVTVGALGKRLYLDTNTLTPLLKRLEGMGHLTRTRDSRDERVVRIRLTDQGRALQAQATDALACVHAMASEDDIDLKPWIDALNHLRSQALKKAQCAGG
jgi:DNA-binding MarR family transcriptional regulator